MVSTEPPALPIDTGKQYLLYLQISIILLYKPCLKYPLDTGQVEILLQLCLSPKLGGFYKRGEIVFAKQTQADMPPFLTYFMPRHTTLHTTLEQFLHFQTPTHPNPYLPNLALFFNQPPLSPSPTKLYYFSTGQTLSNWTEQIWHFFDGFWSDPRNISLVFFPGREKIFSK